MHRQGGKMRFSLIDMEVHIHIYRYENSLCEISKCSISLSRINVHLRTVTLSLAQNREVKILNKGNFGISIPFFITSNNISQ